MKLWDASIESHLKWLDPDSGQFADKYVEKRSCPVCNSTESELMFHKEGGQYERCTSCSMVYLNPVFKDEYLEEYYVTNHSVQSETVQSDLTFYNRIYGQGLDLAKPYFSAGDILDIGCSAGLFLNLAKTRGFNTSGIELNAIESEMASLNHKIYNCNISDIDSDTRFDLVTMWDVFEHIKDGQAILKAIAEKLKPEGGILLQIPSAGSLAARVLQDKCNMFDGLEHVNLYNQSTLTLIAENSGFEVIAYDTVISEASVINNYLNYDNPYLGSFDGKDQLFNEDYILSKQLGYKIQAVLKYKR